MVAILATIISLSAFKNMNQKLAAQEQLINLMQKTKTDQYKETYAYAVSTKDLKAGEIVSDADVDFKQFDQKNLQNFETRSDVVNKVLLKDITTGEAFTGDHIARISDDNVNLREGFRAITLPASKFEGKSSKMKIGSNVDIINTSNNEEWSMENVKIIDLEGASSGIKSSDVVAASSITFEVPAADIADFIANASKGNPVLIARSANDKKIYRKKTRPVSTSNYAGNYTPLPNLPANVPIENMSGLPQPITPAAPQSEVEVIEANVKSKVTFE